MRLYTVSNVEKMWDAEVECRSFHLKWMEQVSPTLAQLKEKAIQILKKEGYPTGEYQVYSLVGAEICVKFFYEVR